MVVVHVVLPVTLFRDERAYREAGLVLVYEDPRYFSEARFHKAKLVLHRASMRAFYSSELRSARRKRYVEFHEVLELPGDCTAVRLHDPFDEPLLRRWERRLGALLQVLPSPNFLLTRAEALALPRSMRFGSAFYPHMRRKLGLLVDGRGKPTGGRWSFDVENRRRLPRGQAVPARDAENRLAAVREARNYVETHFPDNPGSPRLYFPATRQQARRALRSFVEQSLPLFGAFQDAISNRSSRLLFHSGLAASLNIGLLGDREVLAAAVSALQQGLAGIQSVEGFVRQVAGWRQYCLYIYLTRPEIRASSALRHDRRLSRKWWDAATQMPPVDAVVRKVRESGYAHHIERLMVLGNFMLLCQIDPRQVERWFLEFVAIDAYDVFMVPNVLGMSQFADGGVVMTRPYFSSSAYLQKMSEEPWTGTVDLPSGRYPWEQVWDAVYRHFVNRHRKLLRKNYGTASQAAHWDRRRAADPGWAAEQLRLAREYLSYIEAD